MTQPQLAQLAGMSRNFLSQIERGTHSLDVLRLRRLAHALSYRPSDLMPDSAPDDHLA
jgi:transcriptional regulator with XRE-family HTH domain